MLRVGVVGAGKRGRAHLGCLTKIPDTRVVAICDPGVGALDAAAAEFDIPHKHADLDGFLARDLDAIVVVVPAHLNASVTTRVLAKGVPTLAEKPPGLTTAEARDLAATARRHGTKCMVGLNRRFDPIVAEAMALVTARGPIYQMVGEFHKSMASEMATGAFPPNLLDNMIYETPIHAIDLVRSLGSSNIARVDSFVRRAATPYRDVMAALLEFENGCVAQLSINYTTDARLERYEIHGNRISAYIEGIKEAKIVADGKTTVIARQTDSGLRNQNTYFLDSVRNGTPIGAPAADLDEAVKTMELIDAIYAGESRARIASN